jgi:hypothetical protein
VLEVILQRVQPTLQSLSLWPCHVDDETRLWERAADLDAEWGVEQFVDIGRERDERRPWTRFVDKLPALRGQPDRYERRIHHFYNAPRQRFWVRSSFGSSRKSGEDTPRRRWPAFSRLPPGRASSAGDLSSPRPIPGTVITRSTRRAACGWLGIAAGAAVFVAALALSLDDPALVLALMLAVRGGSAAASSLGHGSRTWVMDPDARIEDEQLPQHCLEPSPARILKKAG